MKITLFIISLILLHHPFGLFKDTLRRYNRMKMYGKEENYEVKNGILPYSNSNPIFNFEGFYLSLIGAFIIALYPAFKIFNFSWFFIVLINFVIPIIISPTLAFLTTPALSIKNRNQLGKESYLYIVVGVFLSIVASFL
ncbi:hypothetical protein [Tenacibaculum aestuarii]|uniref:hypothetical protein n=1 Tax=Tenacibaculum aestuarii TaxID=362781 RepID=UPI0038B4F6D2